MKSRAFLYSILVVCMAVFAYFIASLTVLPSTRTIEVPGEGVYTCELKGRTFQFQGTWVSESGPVYYGEFNDRW